MTEISIRAEHWMLRFRIYLEFGAWDLGFPFRRKPKRLWISIFAHFFNELYNRKVAFNVEADSTRIIWIRGFYADLLRKGSA